MVNGVMGTEALPMPPRAFERISSEQLLEAIRADFEERQYLWTGDIDLEIYDEQCEFTDPTISFKGLSSFRSNMKSLTPIIEALVPRKERRCLLRSLESQEDGSVTAKWRMQGDLSLPWQPRIDLGGQTTYTPGSDGRIKAYNERWDIGAAEALQQLLKPKRIEVDHWNGRVRGHHLQSRRWDAQ